MPAKKGKSKSVGGLSMGRAEVDGVYDKVVSDTRKLKLRLPSLRSPDGEFTVGGLMLVFFASRVGSVATKAELAEFLRAMRCPTLDPQPRHLGMQHGLNFLVQGCYHPRARRPLRRGEYCLLDLRRAHPSHSTMHRAKAELSWAPIKALYGMRCACCGSVEGEKHLKNAHLVTTLEKGHCDPRKPLSSDNCIPMCKLCNMVYKDHAVLNRRGFVVRWLKDGPPPGADGVDDADDGHDAVSVVKATRVADHTTSAVPKGTATKKTAAVVATSSYARSEAASEATSEAHSTTSPSAKSAAVPLWSSIVSWVGTKLFDALSMLGRTGLLYFSSDSE